jgi:hypothetical protein
MNLRDEVMTKREEILRLAKEHGASNVRLFGSVARGEERPGSDIDFLVAMGPKTSPWFPVGFIEDLEKTLGHKVDVVTEGMLHWSIREEVLREAKPI